MYRVNVMGPDGAEDATYCRIPVVGDTLATKWGDRVVVMVRLFNQCVSFGLAATVYVAKEVTSD